MICQRQNQQNKTAEPDRWQSRFEKNHILIHKYLDLVYKQYNQRKYDEAHNTFLDLLQVWQYQDVLARSVAVKDYLPSDSLHKLHAVLEQPVNNANRYRFIKEIRRIKLRLINY
ncbi:hypothetical protein [Dyadobacter sediminis]|uniref:hypothetical protein n=1 Tax=Dyadobacter sediminis TaxID=1493691 RepID=UPI0011074155|nr:hypothetical protein [Dyadobacter sediminis]